MKKLSLFSISLAVYLAVVVLAGSPIIASAQTELFPEGNLEVIDSQTELPEGFVFPDKNDTPWLGGNRAEVVQEDGNAAVQFSNNEAFPFFHKIKASIPLPEETRELTFSGRFKADAKASMNPADWSGFHVRAVFSDVEPQGGEVETPLADEMVANVPPNTPDWTEFSTVMEVPEGAKWVAIHIMVNGLVGSFSFDDISVTTP